jgi:hypothetical protein
MCVGLNLGHMSNFFEKFSLSLIHPPLFVLSDPSQVKSVMWQLHINRRKLIKNEKSRPSILRKIF